MRAWLIPVVLLAACAAEKEAAADRALARLDAHTYLGVPVHAGSLTVWPVHTDRPLDVGEFLTLKEAQEQGAVEVREKDGDAEVDTLVVENRADLPILICAGAVLKGGKQDRQIGRDVVVAANTTVPVRAFCVERDRWTMARGGRDTNGRFEATDAVATVGVRSSAQYEGDQRRVWDRIDEVRNNAFYDSPAFTDSSFVDVVERDAKARDDLAATVRAHFRARPDAVGFAYAVAGDPVTVRTFAHARIFRGQFDGFLHAMCTEAALAGESTKRATANDVVAMVTAIGEAEEKIVASGKNDRIGVRESMAGFNGTCYVAGLTGDIVPVSIDWTRR